MLTKALRIVFQAVECNFSHLQTAIIGKHPEKNSLMATHKQQAILGRLMGHEKQIFLRPFIHSVAMVYCVGLNIVLSVPLSFCPFCLLVQTPHLYQVSFPSKTKAKALFYFLLESRQTSETQVSLSLCVHTASQVHLCYNN